MECVFRASALVALVLLAGADGAEVTQCSHSSAPADPAELRDTLRQSACRFNSTEIAAFHAHVQLKHGKSGGECIVFGAGRILAVNYVLPCLHDACIIIASLSLV